MEKEDFIKLKKDIDQAKLECATTKGKFETLMQTLKKEFACETIEHAEKKLAKIAEDIRELQGIIKTKIAEIEEKYDFE